MGARIEGLWIPKPTNDVGASSHRTWDDTKRSLGSPDGTLAGHQDTLTEVSLPGDVVVVAEDGLAGDELGEVLAQRAEGQLVLLRLMRGSERWLVLAGAAGWLAGGFLLAAIGAMMLATPTVPRPF